MRLKEMAEELSDREILDRDVFARQIPPDFQDQIGDEGPQLDVNLFQLMDAFKRIVDQKLPGVQLRIQLEEWSVKEKMELIMDCLKHKGPMFFNEIFSENKTISEFIATFLALLELVHIGLVKLFQPSPEMDIQLTPSFDENG
jgi:segregation and condensation protein A